MSDTAETEMALREAVRGLGEGVVCIRYRTFRVGGWYRARNRSHAHHHNRKVLGVKDTAFGREVVYVINKFGCRPRLSHFEAWLKWAGDEVQAPGGEG